ncbi:hypothetical protein FHG87_000494 [Trinorchestia longiramus]|nr:hypothetical protein FHG87_000494 [Trinorchestia longiramus]
MSERYLYNVTGEVVELPGLTKAVIKFEIVGNSFRALLWSKNFFHEGELLDTYDSLPSVLEVGDRLKFHCHPYDKDPNPDSCDYFAARAWHTQDLDDAFMVANQQGRIEVLEHGKGVLEFTFFEKVEQVLFLRSKYYHFEHRVSNKPLSEFLDSDDMVQFDAVRCKPTQDNKYCSWIAKLVWKGKKPPNNLPSALPDLHNAVMTQDGGDQDDHSAAASSPSEPSRLYEAFESKGTERSARGAILGLVSEEAAVAIWMLAPNRWETVFFHRSVAFLDDIPLSKYNLQESCPKDTRVEITAVEAVENFPCKWVARRVLISS